MGQSPFGNYWIYTFVWIYRRGQDLLGESYGPYKDLTEAQEDLRKKGWKQVDATTWEAEVLSGVHLVAYIKEGEACKRPSVPYNLHREPAASELEQGAGH